MATDLGEQGARSLGPKLHPCDVHKATWSSTQRLLAQRARQHLAVLDDDLAVRYSRGVQRCMGGYMRGVVGAMHHMNLNLI